MRLARVCRLIALSGSAWLFGSCAPPAEERTVTASALFPRDFIRLQSLTPKDSRPYAGFGHATALLGDDLFVGAVENTFGGNSGSVYHFVADGSGWSEVGKLLPGADEGDARFGTGLAASGDTLVVGAPGTDTKAGAVFVYRRTAGDWRFEQRLPAPGPEASRGYFGYVVALNGDLLTVCCGLNYQDKRPGSVHVYRRGPNGFAREAELSASNGSPVDEFGIGMSIDTDRDGDRVAVGAPNALQGTTHSGKAYVFRHESTGWREQAQFTAGEQEDLFGWSLVLSGNSLIVGAPQAPTPPNHFGKLHVWDESAAGWVKGQVISNLASPAGVFIGALGRGVAREGDLLAASDTAHLLVWKLVNGRWTDVAWYLPSRATADVGSNLSLAGGRLVSGYNLESSGQLAGVVDFTTIVPRPPADAAVTDLPPGSPDLPPTLPIDATPAQPSAVDARLDDALRFDAAIPDSSMPDTLGNVTEDVRAMGGAGGAPVDGPAQTTDAGDGTPDTTSEEATPADAACATDALTAEDGSRPPDSTSGADAAVANDGANASDAGADDDQTSCACDLGAPHSSQSAPTPPLLLAAAVIASLRARGHRQRR
jgi:hypothetical protein